MKPRQVVLPVALVAAGCVYRFAIRPWHVKWGATAEEVTSPLPGDDLVPHPKWTTTHAVTIEAPVSVVWPWLVQIGQAKGGFYSYEWLENLVGCHIHNADRIVLEYQHIQVGDMVVLHPKAPPLPVSIVEPDRALVLSSSAGEPFTWSFSLKPVDDNRTRLLVRVRADWKPNVLMQLGTFLMLEPIHFIMERKMLLGIKQRAEATPAFHKAPSAPSEQ